MSTTAKKLWPPGVDYRISVTFEEKNGNINKGQTYVLENDEDIALKSEALFSKDEWNNSTGEQILEEYEKLSFRVMQAIAGRASRY